MKPEDTVKLFEEAGAGKKVLNLGWSGLHLLLIQK